MMWFYKLYNAFNSSGSKPKIMPQWRHYHTTLSVMCLFASTQIAAQTPPDDTLSEIPFPNEVSASEISEPPAAIPAIEPPQQDLTEKENDPRATISQYLNLFVQSLIEQKVMEPIPEPVQTVQIQNPQPRDLPDTEPTEALETDDLETPLPTITSEVAPEIIPPQLTNLDIDEDDNWLSADDQIIASDDSQEPTAELSASFIRKEILAFNPNFNDKTIARFAGDCLQLPYHIRNCIAYTCSAPSLDDPTQLIEHNIVGIEDNKCIYSHKLVETDQTSLQCQFQDRDDRNIYAKGIVEYFYHGSNRQTLNESPYRDDSLAIAGQFDAVRTNQCIATINNEVTPQLADTTPSIATKPASTEQINATGEISPPTSTTIAAPKQTSQVPTQAAPSSPLVDPSAIKTDDAFISYLDEQRRSLPEEKQLSEKILDTIQTVVETMRDQRRQVPTTNQPQGSQKEYIILNPEDSQEPANSKVDVSVIKKDKSNKVDIRELLDSAYRALLAGQISAATSLYRTALEVDHQNEDALFGLATSYHRNAQYEQARDIYTEILETNPNHKEALNNFLVLVGEESPENALLELEKLERINPGFSPIPAQIALIHLKLGHLKRAERYLKRALSLSPENALYKYNLAITSDKLGKREQAVEFYEALLSDIAAGAVVPAATEDIKRRLIFLRKQ